MNYSASDVVLIIGALGLLVTNAITAFNSRATNLKMTEVSDKQSSNATKLDVIHNSTNGNLSKMQEKLDKIEKRLEDSQSRVNDLEKAIIADKVPPVPPLVVAPPIIVK